MNFFGVECVCFGFISVVIDFVISDKIVFEVVVNCVFEYFFGKFKFVIFVGLKFCCVGDGVEQVFIKFVEVMGCVVVV